MSFRPRHTNLSAGLSEQAEIEQLDVLLNTAASQTEALSNAQISQTLLHFLWPEIRRWDPATVPEQLRRLIAVHAVAAGVTLDTSPDDAQEKMNAFFARFEPDLVLSREIEQLALSFLAEDRERVKAETERMIADPKKTGGTSLPDKEKFRASPLLRFEVADQDVLERPFR